MSGSLARELGAWISQVTPAQVGTSRLEMMRNHLLDTIGAALAGSTSPPARIVGQVFSAPGTAQVFGGQARDRGHAVRVNAVAAHALEIDDTEGCDHTGAVVVPVVLALAGEAGWDGSGERALTAMAVGYEVGRRMQLALGGYEAVNERGWHSTATCGVFAAAAAAASMLGLRTDETTAALGIAASSSGGSWAFAADGAMTKRLHPGLAAGAGFDAALLAAAGLTGPARIFDDGWGGVLALQGGAQAAPEELLAGLGTRWHADHSAIKLYGSCRSAHSTLDGVVEVLASDGRTAETFSGARLKVSPFLRRMICPEAVDTIDAARMSLPVSIALLLVGAGLHPAAFERFTEPDIRALVERVEIIEDPAIDVPSLELRFGAESCIIERATARGSEGDPIPAQEVRSKFLALTASVATVEQQHAVLEYVRDPSGPLYV